MVGGVVAAMPQLLPLLPPPPPPDAAAAPQFPPTPHCGVSTLKGEVIWSSAVMRCHHRPLLLLRCTAAAAVVVT